MRPNHPPEVENGQDRIRGRDLPDKEEPERRGNPIFQTAICNSIIPTVKRVQAENVLVEGLARLIVTSIGVYQ